MHCIIDNKTYFLHQNIDKSPTSHKRNYHTIWLLFQLKFQLQITDLQCNENLNSKFCNNTLSEFHKICWPNNKCPALSNHTQQVMSPLKILTFLNICFQRRILWRSIQKWTRWCKIRKLSLHCNFSNISRH